MSSLLVDQFVERMASHLRRLFPEQLLSLNEQDLLKHIQSASAQASHYGVIRDGDVQRYLEYAVLHGWEFDRAPETSWAHPILADESMDGTMKMDALDQYQAASLNGVSLIRPTEVIEKGHD